MLSTTNYDLSWEDGDGWQVDCVRDVPRLDHDDPRPPSLCQPSDQTRALNYQIINCSNNNYKDIYKARASPIYLISLQP